LWDDLSCQIHSFLEGISLGDLVQQREVQSVAARQDGLPKETTVAMPPLATAR
jgi:Rrf2 family iron-sulfur cluster assembly transcriptional regulator